MNFEKQATFVKVEQAARAFCQSTVAASRKQHFAVPHAAGHAHPGVPALVRLPGDLEPAERVRAGVVHGGPEQRAPRPHGLGNSACTQFYYHFVRHQLSPRDPTPPHKYIALPKLTKQSRISHKEKQELASYGEGMLNHSKGSTHLTQWRLC